MCKKRFILKKILILCLIFISFISIVNAEEKELNVNFIGLKDDFSNGIVYFNLRQITTNERFEGYSQLKEFKLHLKQGLYNLEIWIDEELSEGFDYYTNENIFIYEETEDLDLIVNPIGGIEISITDNRGRALENIIIHIRCDKNYGNRGYFESDSLGMFFLKDLAVGECIIRTADSEQLLRKKVEIEKGKIKEINFVFKDNNTNYDLFFIIILIIFIIVLIIIFKKKIIKLNINKENIIEEKSEIKEDAYNVLNQQEKKIIDFLIEEEKDNNKPIYQAKIVHGTKIPKTTLSKILPILESKNIIKIEKIGKTKTIKLSSWFKNKE
ncbi:MAG: helix-turn-helix transcriptional regulator [Candidatus Woesearchaeota archaeon]